MTQGISGSSDTSRVAPQKPTNRNVSGDFFNQVFQKRRSTSNAVSTIVQSQQGKHQSQSVKSPVESRVESRNVLLEEGELTFEKLQKAVSHPLSKSLPENPHTSEKDYPRVIDEAYAEQYIYPRNGRFIKDGSIGYYYKPPKKEALEDSVKPNIGWKFHLNVLPQHARRVGDYLIHKNINHKYFSGGELDDGKVFTVYVGSFELARVVARLIEGDIGEYLCKPKELSEVEFARGVVARFTAIDYVEVMDRGDMVDKYHQYGDFGMSYFQSFVRSWDIWELSNIKHFLEISPPPSKSEFEKFQQELRAGLTKLNKRQRDLYMLNRSFGSWDRLQNSLQNIVGLERQQKALRLGLGIKNFQSLKDDFGAYFMGGGK